MQQYFGNVLCKYQCAFRKSYNSLDYLIIMIEKWREIIDMGGA